MELALGLPTITIPKVAVRNLIDMARKAVVGLIQAFGEVLKGLVSVALAAFPAAAAKARAWIDARVYEKIGGSLLTIAITLAMMLVGEIAANLAKAIWEGVVGLLRGKAPEVEVKVEVKPGDAEPKAGADTGAKPDTATPDAASQKGVAAERPTADGHKIKVLEDGRVFICTTCEQLNFKYGEELKASTELKEKWEAANAETDPQAKADKVEALQKELADARKKSMAGETTDVKIGRLDAMVEQARQALGRLKEALRKKGGKLASTNGPLKGKVDGDLPQLDRQLTDFQKDAGVAKEMKDPASLDEYREKLDDVRAKADELTKEVNDAVPDAEPPLAAKDIQGAPPGVEGGSPGHARSAHGFTNDMCADVINNAEQAFRGTNDNGRAVDVYYRDGDVVITEAGKRNSVITGYGKSEPGGTAVDPAKWASDPRYTKIR